VRFFKPHRLFFFSNPGFIPPADAKRAEQRCLAQVHLVLGRSRARGGCLYEIWRELAEMIMAKLETNGTSSIKCYR
jgi:hypothetical protein